MGQGQSASASPSRAQGRAAAAGGGGEGGSGNGSAGAVNYSLLAASDEGDAVVDAAARSSPARMGVKGTAAGQTFGVVPLSSSDDSDSDDNAELVSASASALSSPLRSSAASSLNVNGRRADETLLLTAIDDTSDGSEGDGEDDAIVGVRKPPQESFLSITLQIFFPFLVAGMGMVGAGLVLDVVQHWRVFEVVSELFILVPALLGLKGNLEMTLASRLSTHANLGNMDGSKERWSMVISNLALVQCQAIVVALLASVFAVAMDWIKEGIFDLDHGLLLCASSLVTASLASFALGLVMVAVILASRRCRVNPDNVATPIAASLGDLTTLALLSWIASVLFADLEREKWLAPVIVGCYLLFVPVCACVARINKVKKIIARFTLVVTARAGGAIDSLCFVDVCDSDSGVDAK